MKTDKGSVILSNFTWRLLERFGAQGVTFLVSIILARVLEPEIYGTIALITVVTTILQVFVNSGLGSALIQKLDADDIDFSTVFYFNFIVCVVLYVLLYFFSPALARFYNRDELTPIIRTLGLILIISGFKNIQNAYVSRNLLFKKYFFATLGGTITAAVIGIGMAYKGFGVWALVAQNLVNQFIDTLILWITVKWRPKAFFSFSRLKVLLKYGYKLLFASLLDTIWNQVRQLIIGKKYSSSDLAFYNKGNELPQDVSIAISSSIDSVLFPVMSKAQESSEEVKRITRRAIKVESFVLWPLMLGLCACANSVILLLYTGKWLFAVPYLRIFCITYAFYPIHTANLNAIKALGRSDIFLKLEVIKKIVNLGLIIGSMWFGVYIMALSALIGSIASQIINSWPNKRLLNYSYFEQLLDIIPSLILSIIMAILVLCVVLLHLSPSVTLIIQIPLGMIIYYLGAKVTKNDSLPYLIRIVKHTFTKGRKHSGEGE